LGKVGLMDSSFIHVQINKNETSSSGATNKKRLIKEEKEIINLENETLIDVRQMKMILLIKTKQKK